MSQGSLRFWIMDAMADDWESLDQIAPVVDKWWQPTPRHVVAEQVVSMVEQGVLEEMPHDDRGDDRLTPEAIVADPMRFWFGMTKRGRILWENEGAKIMFPDEGA
jgi:hypothetical protein